jgi:hypothetical protein
METVLGGVCYETSRGKKRLTCGAAGFEMRFGTGAYE